MEFQKYPRQVHGPERSFKVVYDDAERDAAVAQGWYLWPHEVPDADLGEGARPAGFSGSGENQAARDQQAAADEAPARKRGKRKA